MSSGRSTSCLLIFCGVPGAGKSSISASVAEAARKAGVDATLIEFDQIQSPGRTPTQFNPENWKVSMKAILFELFLGPTVRNTAR